MKNIKLNFDKTTMISFHQFVRALGTTFEVSPEAITSKSRLGDVSHARGVGMYILSKYGGLTSLTIGRLFARDHATVLYHIKKFALHLSLYDYTNKELEDAIHQIKIEGAKEYKQDFSSLFDRAVVWGTTRGLNNPHTQAMKLAEEVGELMSAILKNKRDEQVDAFGDILVVVSILADQLGVSLEQAFDVALLEIEARKGSTVNGSFIKEQDQLATK